jgi:hypothetical protein
LRMALPGRQPQLAALHTLTSSFSTGLGAYKPQTEASWLHTAMHNHKPLTAYPVGQQIAKLHADNAQLWLHPDWTGRHYKAQKGTTSALSAVDRYEAHWITTSMQQRQ